MADKYFLAKKTDAKITAAQVEKLEDVAVAAKASAIADYTITWTVNEPTAGNAATISDGDAATDAESGQAIADLTAKLNSVLTVLRSNGLIAS